MDRRAPIPRCDGHRLQSGMAREDAFVAPHWLVSHLDDPRVRIVDGSWYLPSAGRNPRAEYIAAHVPGAVFFDIDTVADRTSDLPHMLPDAAAFGAAVGALGIGNDDRVVVYDGAGLFSAARVWWMFRAFGHDDVFVLDGGLPRWRAEGRAMASGTATPRVRDFAATLQPTLLRTLEQMRTTEAQVVDARGRGRFEGRVPEPRPNVRSGHIPGSRNLPFDMLVRDGALVDADEIRAAFASAGVDVGGPVDLTCGSGVTASVLAIALFVAGHRKAAVYDGSWAEWGGRNDTPVVNPSA